MLSDTLILGVGNPLYGDDAVGVRVAHALQQRSDLPPHVTVVDGGTEGIGLIPLMETYRRVIVVDAVPMDVPPGTIRRFTWQDAHFLAPERALSLHQSDLTEALVLAEALGSLPHELVIYGIQPHNIGWDQGLSPEIQRALPVVVATLIEEVRRGKDGKEDSDY
ncbi:MAG: hydrogenase maturation protease [Chloroflexi bacterium]|nr:MAG: hydrogenase maturation protease [Chloroflexota bacterium]